MKGDILLLLVNQMLMWMMVIDEDVFITIECLVSSVVATAIISVANIISAAAAAAVSAGAVVDVRFIIKRRRGSNRKSR